MAASPTWVWAMFWSMPPSGEVVPPTRRLISEPYVPLAQINVGRLPLKIDMDAAAITTCRFFGMTTMRAMLATMAIIEPRD